MKTFKWVIAVAALCSAGAVFAARDSGLVVTHFEQMQNLRLERSATSDVRLAIDGAPITLRFDAMGRTFDLQLESNGRLLSPAARAAIPKGIQLYRGGIAGAKDSWLRIVIADGIPRGMLWDGTEMYALEAPGDSAVATDRPVIYRLADTYMTPGSMSCGAGADLSSGSGSVVYDKLIADLQVAVGEAQGATTQLNLGTIGDAAFVADMNNSGIDPATAIYARLNIVDGIFSEQLGVQLAVQTPELFDVDPSPFTGTTNASDLLDELSNYRGANPAQNTQGLTHMYTGLNLDGTTVGIAYIDALCSSRFGVGLSQGDHGVTIDSIIAAHEIGHNFGAPHDNEQGSVCESETDQFIMAPSVNNADRFSDCSIEQMQLAMAGKNCFVALPGVDMSITAATPSLDVLLGNSATANFDVENIGSDAATNVSVDIGVPDLAVFLSANATTGSCTSGAGAVNCQLGTVAGGGTATVGVTSISSAVGSGSFDATVSATVDDNGTNDQASAQLIVNPAVDLAIGVPGVAQLALNQSGTVSVSFSNSAIIDAVNVTLAVVVDPGVTIDSASWDIGSCAFGASQIDCEAATFASQSTAALSFAVTGAVAGTLNYSITLATDTDDRDESNNAATGTISVNNPAPPPSNADGGGSGGGGTGFPELLLLFAAVACRRLRGAAWSPPGAHFA